MSQRIVAGSGLAGEPAKLIGWIVAAVIVVGTVITEALTTLTDVIPEKNRASVAVVVAVLSALTVAATRVQAVMTRARVYAPASFGLPDATIPAAAVGLRAGSLDGKPPATYNIYRDPGADPTYTYVAKTPRADG